MFLKFYNLFNIWQLCAHNLASNKWFNLSNKRNIHKYIYHLNIYIYFFVDKFIYNFRVYCWRNCAYHMMLCDVFLIRFKMFHISVFFFFKSIPKLLQYCGHFLIRKTKNKKPSQKLIWYFFLRKYFAAKNFFFWFWRK